MNWCEKIHFSCFGWNLRKNSLEVLDRVIFTSYLFLNLRTWVQNVFEFSWCVHVQKCHKNCFWACFFVKFPKFSKFKNFSLVRSIENVQILGQNSLPSSIDVWSLLDRLKFPRNLYWLMLDSSRPIEIHKFQILRFWQIRH